MYAHVLKRLLDVVGSVLAAVLTAPLTAVAGCAVRTANDGPVIYRQTRIGRDGREFVLLKFRTMTVGTSDVDSAHMGHPPVTSVGRWLRRWNIDELPQLWNVITGDMSLVGPRPALPSQAELLRIRRTNGSDGVRPGLTGLAQISSYDGMTDTVKAAFDGRYAESIAILADLRIVVGTFRYLAKPPPRY